MTAYTYITNIPASGNNPSADQPNMQTNTNSINSIIATDHVGFNTTGPIGPPNGVGGQHLQVSFNGNNVPGAFPVPLPVLFTNLVHSLAQLFYYSGSAAQSANQYVDGASGSTFALGGILIKWGVYTSGGGGTQTVLFNPAFNNNCFSVILTPASVFNGAYYIVSSNNTQFVAQTIPPTPGINFNYIAIGD